MERVQYTVKLDLTDNGFFDTGWRIKQGDSGNSEIIALVLNNGINMFNPAIIPEIVFKRPDGKSIISTMEIAGNNYKYVFVGNELEVPGTVIMDVKITDSEGRISTNSVRFECVEDTIGYDPDGSHTYNNPVSEIAQEALAKAEKSEAWAVGTRNGVPVSEGDETYNNNAKYWAEHSSGGSSADVKYYERNGFLSKNLLNPTMETTTIGELTCRNNGDGTYTLKGEYNGGEEFILQTDVEISALEPYRLVGCPSNIMGIYLALDVYVDNGSGKDFVSNVPIKLTLKIVVPQGMGILANDGLTFTPMLSHDINTTMSDFMPYAPSNIDLQKQIDQGGGGSTSYYGTSAEFEEFKKRTDIPDGTEYIVTDDYSDGGSSGNSNIYSLEETLIGEFLGKPLYRKVYRTAENGISIATSKTSVDTYVDNKAEIETIITATILRPTGYSGYGNFTSQGGAYIEDGVIKLYSGTTSATNITHFILEYTKVGD